MSEIVVGTYFIGAAGNFVWSEKGYYMTHMDILSNVHVLLSISPKKLKII